jgi:hypothetical protein
MPKVVGTYTYTHNQTQTTQTHTRDGGVCERDILENNVPEERCNFFSFFDKQPRCNSIKALEYCEGRKNSKMVKINFFS